MTAATPAPVDAAAPATPSREPVPRWLALPVRYPRGTVSWGVIILPVIAIACAYALPSRLVLPGLGAAGRPTVVLGIGLLILWLLAPLARARQPSPSWPLRILLAVYWIVLLVAFAVGFDRGLNPVEANAAYRSLLASMGVTGLLLAVAESTRKKADLDRILGTVVIGAAFMSLVGVLQGAFDLDLTDYIQVPGLVLNRELIDADVRGDGDFARVAGTAQHYIEYGTTAALALPLAIHFWRRAGARLISWSALAVVLIGLAVPFSVSRTSFLAAAVTLIFLMLALRGRQLVNLVVVATAAVAFFNAVQPGVLGTVRALFFNAQNDPSIEGRTNDYPIVAEYIADRPFLGRGTGTFEPSVYLILDNQILMTILTTGFVGLAALSLLLGGSVVAVWAMWTRTRDPVDRELGLIIVGTVVAGGLVSGTFDSFAFPTFATTLWVLVGAGFALFRLVMADRGAGAPGVAVPDPAAVTLISASVAAPPAPRPAVVAVPPEVVAPPEVAAPPQVVAPPEVAAPPDVAPPADEPSATEKATPPSPTASAPRESTRVPKARAGQRERRSDASTWEAEWWVPRKGPTEHARQVFRGDDAWLLAWVIHQHTDGALAVVGSDRSTVSPTWRPHVLVEVSPGTYVDIDGVKDADSVAPPAGGRRRIFRAPDGITFEEYAVLVTGAPPAAGGDEAPPDEDWWSVSSRSTAPATRYIASRLLLANRIPHRGLRSG